MERAFQTATKTATKSSSKNKEQYDKKVRHTTLLPGDRVLIRNLSQRGGTGKLRNFWEENIHVVEKQISKDSPVYQVRPENGKGPSRVLHRNLLMGCDSLPLEKPEEDTRNRTAAKKRSPQPRRKSLSAAGVSEEEDDQEELKFLPFEGPLPSVPLDPRSDPFVPRCAIRGTYHVEEDTAPVETFPQDQVINENLHGNVADTRPQRFRRAPMRLTYDEYGQMQEYPQTYCISCNRPYLSFVHNGLYTYPPDYPTH